MIECLLDTISVLLLMVFLSTLLFFTTHEIHETHGIYNTHEILQRWPSVVAIRKTLIGMMDDEKYSLLRHMRNGN